MSSVPGIKKDKFQKKPLSKLAVRLMKLYKAPQGKKKHEETDCETADELNKVSQGKRNHRANWL